MGDDLLTLREIAAKLRVHPETVRNWVRDGELQAIQLGGRSGYRVTESELHRFIESRKSPRQGAEHGNL